MAGSVERASSIKFGMDLARQHQGKLHYFEYREIWVAYGYALGGGQALHDNPLALTWPGAPQVFRRSKRAGHLFDQDADRLVETVRSLGVKVVVVHGGAGPRQHVDLCGKPMERALDRAINGRNPPNPLAASQQGSIPS